MEHIADTVEVVLIDTGAGVSPNVPISSQPPKRPCRHLTGADVIDECLCADEGVMQARSSLAGSRVTSQAGFVMLFRLAYSRRSHGDNSRH